MSDLAERCPLTAECQKRGTQLKMNKTGQLAMST